MFIGNNIDMEVKVSRCSQLMAEQQLTVAFAESATAGWLCSEFALTEDSGEVLKGGITCYDASLKVALLKVPQELIDQHTPNPWSDPRNGLSLRDLIPSDIQVTVTGLTTPGDSETSEKPLGTMFVFALIMAGKQVYARSSAVPVKKLSDRRSMQLPIL